jgi:hypothetical protein
MPVVLTAAARRGHEVDLPEYGGVADRAQLARLGISAKRLDAQLAAGRWRLVGTAVLLHNGPMSRHQYEQICLINCGPRAVLTSFTGAAAWGLRGWERDDVYVLAPAGTLRPDLPRIRLHRTRDWSRAAIAPGRRLHRLAPALVIAAASFRTPRPGAGLLAAAVQQRLLGPNDLRTALEAALRTRHRRALLLAVDDIAQGAQALSEIDFRRMCRRHRLPPPSHQGVRTEPDGRRRYLDVEWRRDGRTLAVEVDGAYHLDTRQWNSDQLRQNEVVIGGTPVLRFPSIVVRHEEHLVVSQLRRALARWH